MVGYRTGRWFRRLVLPSWIPQLSSVDPSEVSWVLGDCIMDGILYAPVLRSWFIYEPDRREHEVADINHTCFDIRWFIGRLLAQPGEEPVTPRITSDMLVIWSNIPGLCTGNPVPAVDGPEQEWMVYMGWVHFVLTRSKTARKAGRIRRQYDRWLGDNFPDVADPIGATRKGD